MDRGKTSARSDPGSELSLRSENEKEKCENNERIRKTKSNENTVIELNIIKIKIHSSCEIEDLNIHYQKKKLQL